MKKLKTVSQLPQDDQIYDGSYIGISQISGNGGYVSRKISFGDFREQIKSQISGFYGKSFKIYGENENEPVDISSSYYNMQNILSGDTKFDGLKIFGTIPEILCNTDDYGDLGDEDTYVATVGKVKDVIQDNACFISPSYKVDSNIGADSTPAYVKDGDNLMHWHFDDGTMDSTKWVDPSTGTTSQENGVACPYTGYLTIYGWLADKGTVLPQDAWVGLFAKEMIFDQNNNVLLENKWVPIQIQPWIKGSYSSQLQYIGFNVPVRRGLFLKIKTGFLVNGNVGGFQDSRSLTYALNQPNSFVGYISRVED